MYGHELVVLDARRALDSSLDALLQGLPGRRLVALGEVHQHWEAVGLARLLLLELCQTGQARPALLVEYFNVKQQSLLDAWQSGRLDWRELLEEYSRGPEGFNLEAYKPLLEAARDCGAPIMGVMPPRSEANTVAKTGTLPREAPLPYDPDSYPGYREALSPLFPRTGPMARIPLERLLLAQSYKDTIAATVVAGAIREGYTPLLVMGWAHIIIPWSVPHRALALAGLPRNSALLAATLPEPYEAVRSMLVGEPWRFDADQIIVVSRTLPA